jgi:hypothetical protein
MSKYPKPPFETKDIIFIDTFDPELGASQKVVDLNEFSNAKLFEMYFSDPVARKLLDWRHENNVGIENESDSATYEFLLKLKQSSTLIPPESRKK